MHMVIYFHLRILSHIGHALSRATYDILTQVFRDAMVKEIYDFPFFLESCADI
jgi:hypothetical protein